ncbi:eukaryotic aspartyl protease family protein [Striga asiatica]|uniref:Eukaryotic aspartyl protease family protein n=1 Tax=Striga asiatica TaxID=4170 RepID=A0A5A7PXC8_STRAF|nr:eukaryotic aspartyl protease family protein [Striga asiatica]
MDHTSLLILTTALFIIISISSTPCTSSHDPCPFSKPGPDLSIIHIYGKCSPFDPPKPDSSWPTTILNMATKNDPKRISYLSSLATAQNKPTSAPIAPGHVINVGNYVVRARIGTPGQLMFMVLDTSNDAAWVPCANCTGCSSNYSFAPNTSSTYGPVDCSGPECAQASGLSCPAAGPGPCLFNRTYGGDSSFSATLARDSFSLGNDVIPDYAFGCVGSVSGSSVPAQGLLGLGRGSLSLLAQSGARYSGIFSYCLPSFKSYYFSGSLRLGPLGQPKSIKTTPLLKNPHRPSLYYVNLTGVSVGRVNVPVDPTLLDFDPNTGAGTIIDSGTVITRFVRPVYDLVRDEFRRQVKGPFSSLGAFDTCFAATNDELAPVITFRFTGMDLKLPTENSLIHSSSGSLACLAMAAAPDNVNSVLNVIANLQQQNLRIVFDTVNSRLGIAREVCN